MKVLHAPFEISGQLWEYAEGLRAAGFEASVFTFLRHLFGYKADIVLFPKDKWNNFEKTVWIAIKLPLIVKVMLNFEIFHFHFGSSLLPKNIDIPILKCTGKKITMSFWGSDVRLKHIAKQKNPFFIDEIEPVDDKYKIKKMKRLAKYIKHVIVSDYELYEYVSMFFENVHVVRQAIDVENLKSKNKTKKSDKVVIVHSPSNKVVKGTEFVEKALKSLSTKYEFEYIKLTGMSHEEVIKTIKDADIVVDQLLVGTYGILAVESMALGKPVVCYIRDDLVEKYPPGLPVVNANPENVREILEKLIKEKELRERIGQKSRDYAEQYHDRRKIAKQLVEIYNKL